MDKLGGQGKIAISSLSNSLLSMNKNAATLNSSLSKIATTMGNTIRWGITSSIFQSMISSVSGAVSYMKELDKSLTQIQMVSQASSENMRQLAQYANEAAQGLATTTVNYTNAIKVFTQEGFTLPEAKLQAELSVKLANVSEQDTATTADQITAYRNAFGLSIEEMTQSLDKLANVANNTAANVGELMTAAQRSASVAAAVGASEDMFIASVSTIQSVTRQSAEEIGNGLKTIMQRFADIRAGGSSSEGGDSVDYGEYAQALKKVGVDVLDATGEFKGFDQIIRELQDVWGNLSETMKVAVGEKVAGKFQYNRFAALMNNADYFDKAYASTQNADGMMDQMQDVYTQSIEGRLKTLQAAGEQVMSTLFDQDSVEPMLENLTNFVNLLNDIVNSMGGLSGVLQVIEVGMLRAFGPSISGQITNVVNSIQNMIASSKSQKEMTASFELFGFNNINKEDLPETAQFGASVAKNYQYLSEDTQQRLRELSSQLLEMETEKQAVLEQQNKQIEVMKNHAINNVALTSEQLVDWEIINETINSISTEEDQRLSVEKQIKEIQDEINKLENNRTEESSKRLSQLKSQKIALEQSLDTIQVTLIALEEELEIYQNTTKITKEQAAALQIQQEEYVKIIGELEKYNIQVKNGKELNQEQINSIKILISDYKKLYGNAEELEKVVQQIAEASNKISMGKMLADSATESAILESKLTKISNGIANITSLAFGFSMISSAIKVCSDESATLEEKIESIALNGLMGISMMFPVLIETAKAFKELAIARMLDVAAIVAQDNAQRKKIAGDMLEELSLSEKVKLITEELYLRIKNIASLIAETIAQNASNAAKIIRNILDKKWVALAAAVIVGVAAITTGLIALTTSIIKTSNGTLSASEEFEKQQNILNSLSDTLDNLQNRYDELSSAIDEISSKENALDNLTRGTEEWNKAVLELNETVIDTAEKYGLLNDVVNNNGVFSIKEGVLEEALNAQQEELTNTQNTLLAQQVVTNRAEYNKETSQFASDHMWNNRTKNFTTNTTEAVQNAVEAFVKNGGSIYQTGTNSLINEVGKLGLDDAGLEAFKELAISMQKNTDASNLNTASLTAKTKNGDSISFGANSKDIENAAENAYSKYAETIYNDDGSFYETLNKKGEASRRNFLAQGLTTSNGKTFTGSDISETKLQDGVLKIKVKGEWIDTAYEDLAQATESWKIQIGTEFLAEEYKKAISQFTSNANGTVQDKIAMAKSFTNASEELKAEWAKQGITNIQEFCNALQSGQIAVDQFTAGMSKISSASTFSELAGAYNETSNIASDKDEAYTGLESLSYTSRTNDALNNQLNSITQSEAVKYDLDFDEIIAQANALADAFNLDSIAARELAIQNQRMNNGIKELSDNWDDWNKILQNSNKYDKDYVKTTKQLNKVIKELVGSSEDLNLSEEFYDSAENMELLEQAAQGSEEAINQLGFAVGKNLIQSMEISSERVEAVRKTINELNNSGDDLNLSSPVGKLNEALQNFDSNKQIVIDGLDTIANAGLQAGQQVSEAFNNTENYEQWVNSLNQMAAATGMSAAEMNSFLNTIGVHAEVEEDYVTMTKKVPHTTTHHTVQNMTTGSNGESSWDEVEWTETKYSEETGEFPVASIKTGEGTGGITFTGNGSVGSSNKSSGNGGGGGGGGGKAKKKRTEKADKNKRDPFIEIKNAIERQTSELEKQEELDSELYGTNKIKNLDRMIKSHQKLAELYQEEAKIQREQIEMQKNQDTDEYGNLTVKGLAGKVGITVEYNEAGDIINGKAIQDALYAKYVAAYDEETYHSDEDDYSSYTENTKYWKDLYDQWVSGEKDFGDMLDNLDDINSNIRSTVDSMQETNNSIIEELHSMLEEWRKLSIEQHEFNQKMKEFDNGASLDNMFAPAAEAGKKIFDDIINWNGTGIDKDGNKVSISTQDIDSISSNMKVLQGIDEMMKTFFEGGELLDSFKAERPDENGNYDWSKAQSIWAEGNITGIRDAILKGNSEEAQRIYDDVLESINNNNGLTTEQRQIELDKFNDYIDKLTEAAKQVQDINTKITYTSLTGGSMWTTMMGQAESAFKKAQKAFGYDEETGFSTNISDFEIDEEGNLKFSDLTQQDAYDRLQDALQSGQDTIESLMDAIEKEEDVISDGIDKMADLIDRQIEAYENVTDRLDSISSINDLMYGESEIGLSNKIAIDDASIEALQGKLQTINAGIGANQDVIDYFQKIANATGESLESLKTSEKISQAEAESLQTAQDNITGLQQEQMDTEAELLETIASRLETKAIQEAKNLANSLLGGDAQWMQEEWEMRQRNEELYLDDMNRAYNVQKLQYSYQQMLNDSANNNALIQQKIAAHMEDQLDYLQGKEKLSQTDIDYANARLAILQKQIALEDAQSNKTQMRLQRDASGNYSYVYTANEDDLAQKQQDLLDAQINAYNIAKEGLLEAERGTIDEIASMQDQIVSIMTDTSISVEERKARIQEVMGYLGEYTEARTEQIKTYSLETLQSVTETEDYISDENAGNLADIYNTMEYNLTAALGSIDDRFDLFATKTGQDLGSVENAATALSGSMVGLANATNDSFVSTLEKFSDLVGSTSNAESFIGRTCAYLDQFKASSEKSMTYIGSQIDPLKENFDGLAGLINSCQTAIQNLNKVSLSTLEENLSKVVGQINVAISNLHGEDGKSGMHKALIDVKGDFQDFYTNAMKWLTELNAKIGETTTGITSVGDAIGSVNQATEPAKNDPTPPQQQQQQKPSEPSGSYGTPYDVETLAEGIAGSIWIWGNYGSYSNWYDGVIDWHDKALADRVKWYMNNRMVYGDYRSWDYYKQFMQYDTGGYTGNWFDHTGESKNGKLAVLHQKELVLNATDTENLLDIIKQVRQMQNINLSQNFDLSRIGSQVSHDTIEQRVEITAEFPGVTSSQEIETALLNLADIAYQSAHRNY